ncbi:MAG: helix-hairpin-helix domain-containing protein, partial [Owenweeksia sp.]
MKCRILISLVISFSFFHLRAQTPSRSLEYEIESIAEGNEENETDLVQLAEQLELLKENPIQVNFADLEGFQKLPYLNIFQVHNLLEYRRQTGLIFSPYELLAVKGFDKETIDKILPFLEFTTQESVPSLKARNVRLYSNHNIIYRTIVPFQRRAGFIDPDGYQGSPESHYLRLRSTYKDVLSFNVTAQQDAGEPFGGSTGVDFLSVHLALQNYGRLRNLIIGDFQAEFGQGLALWSGLTFGKSAEPVEIKRYARGFRPFSGAEENRFFRGAAATYRFLDGVDVSLFYSNNRIDANVSSLDTLTQNAIVSSLQTTGLHRTESEIADKNTNILQAIGGNINYRGEQFSLGGTVVNYQLGSPLEQSPRLYQQFRFSGTDLAQYSVDFNYLFRDINLFGEVAISDNGAWAGTAGLQSHPADALYLTVLYRHFKKEYQFLYNAPFAENGNYGERGTYLGFQWLLNRVFQLRSYLDIYRFEWLRFRVDAPSRGRDFLVQLDASISRRFSMYFRFKNEIQEVNNPQETPNPDLVFQARNNFRVHSSYQVFNNLRMASRFELSYYDIGGEHEKGNVLFQDIQYQFRNVPLKLSLRYALIDTRSFNTRIYAYENDLTYAFSIPPYYGKSNRFYLLADWDVFQNLTFQAKYSITKFTDREEISSGLSMIDGNVQSGLGLQLIWKL